MNPRISVVIPTYQRPDATQRAVKSALSQSIEDLEVLVIDDASPNFYADTLVALDPKRVRVLRLESNAGPSAARNRGIDIARGQWIAFLDSDDTWHPEKLERQLALARVMKDAFVYCRFQIDDGSKTARILPHRAIRAGENIADYIFLHRNLMQTSTLLVPAWAATRIRFDERLRRFEDIDFVIRLQATGLMAMMADPILACWHHDHRPDRLTLHPSPEGVEIFLDMHSKTMGKRAAEAFYASNVLAEKMRREPLKILPEVLRRATRGSLGPSWYFQWLGRGIISEIGKRV